MKNESQQNEHWARSANGSHIALSRSGHQGPSAKNPILIIGGVHGDEPHGVLLAHSFLDWAKSQSPQETKPWIVIPCINPDGYEKSKRCNGNDVDLNRNFPSSNWQEIAHAQRYHPGPSPGSESETQALLALIKQEQPQLIIHCHSWQPCIVFTGPPGEPAAQHLADSSAYKCLDHIGYHAPGSLGDYGWYDLGIPVICIEVANEEKESRIWPLFKTGFERILAL